MGMWYIKAFFYPDEFKYSIWKNSSFVFLTGNQIKKKQIIIGTFFHVSTLCHISFDLKYNISEILLCDKSSQKAFVEE